jgi:lipopolysaccharide transport system permease protein
MGIAAIVREMAREQLEYRELLLQLVKRDLALRYKQTVMGFAWAVFTPLVNTAVFSVIFTRVAPVDTGVPYPLYAFCGFLFWNFFASSLRFAAVSLTSNMTLVTKVYFPREILAFSAVVVCLVDLVVGSSVLIGLMAYYRVPVTAALGLAPIILLCQLAFTAGMSLALAMMNLFYRDVKYLFEVVLTVWMFATAVMYPIDRVGGRLASVLALNPMTGIIDAYRAVLLHGQLPDPVSFGWALGVSLITLSAAWWAFHAAEFRFAESI